MTVRTTEAQVAPAASGAATRRGRSNTVGRKRIIGCLIVIACYVLIALIGPLLMQYDPVRTFTEDRLLPPGSTTSQGTVALFGTDQVGQDILAQMMLGARVSITVGAGTLALAGFIGVTIGLLAGYRGGWLDSVLMRLADIQLSFPSILLAILIAAVVGPSVVNVIVVLAITNWVTFARVTRGQVLTVKNREYVDAARTLGARHLHLVLRTIFPACLAPILVVATVELGQVILAEASLSFLGLGVPTGVPSWGTTIANGRSYLGDAWWISTLPGVALATLVLTCGVLGDAMRDRYDPKMRSL
ncbi:ABC transporter permease [Ruania alba]|uniref:Peptide/nickel transport system permease protein n=1 Tax=Ruania alba TaxID=648782 RepID=A0A1H5HR74_9MICO|nr:ABC transporter permease [Ruania alba]SEE30294.1 peptide/nickel transport system permease protein [Ruania alba]